jgi:hypothetical protein
MSLKDHAGHVDDDFGVHLFMFLLAESITISLAESTSISFLLADSTGGI